MKQLREFERESGLEIYGLGLDRAKWEAAMQRFSQLIIGHATECVRDVLREEDSDLSYTAATQVQNRIKENFGVE
jgi:hypothetical protein